MNPSFALLLALVAPQAREIVRGPYLQQVTTDAAIVVLDLDVRGSPEIRLGEGGAQDPVFSSAAPGEHHEIRLTGLAPDTSYAWSVFLDGERLGDPHALHTAAGPDAPFSFVLYGDSRSGHDAHASVVAAAAREDVEFAVNTGDLVTQGDATEDWDTLFTIIQPLAERVPLYPVVGNHDVFSGDAAAFRDAFALPGNELYYAFDHGNAHFVVLDGHVNASLVCTLDDVPVLDCLSEEQLAWLEADLREACGRPEIDLAFVLTHVGPYSSKDGRPGSAYMRMLLPLFAETGVAGILSGHDHYYERGLAENGIPYVVSGGGGAPLYEPDTPCEAPHTVVYAEKANHYTVIEVDGLDVRITAKRPDGRVIDTASFRAADTCVAPQTPIDSGTVPPRRCGCASGPAGGPSAVLGLAALVVLRRRRAS